MAAPSAEAASGQERIVPYIGAAAIGSLIMINSAEQPFARSLISCDVPVDTAPGAPFSGSAHCGDRLYVIAQGQRLSGMGQVLEQAARLSMILIISSVADVAGRRVALLVGLSCVAASAGAFALACVARPWAWALFAVAQGLQGAHGMTTLMDIVYSDIALRLPGPDSLALFCLRDKLNAVTAVLFAGAGMSLQFLDITDFTRMWAAIFLLAVLVVLVTAAWMPETRPAEKLNGQQFSLAELLVDEVHGYWRLSRKSRFMAYMSLSMALHGAQGGVFSVFFPWLMAHFRYTQAMTILTLGPIFLVQSPALRLYRWLTRKIGHRRTFDLSSVYMAVLHYVTLPIVGRPVNGMPLPAFFKLYMSALCVGQATATKMLSARIVGQEDIAKYGGLCGIVEISFGMASTFIYMVAFDAQATEYLARIRVIIIQVGFFTVQLCLYCFGTRRRWLQELDAVQAEEDAKQGQPSEPAGSKKRD